MLSEMSTEEFYKWLLSTIKKEGVAVVGTKLVQKHFINEVELKIFLFTHDICYQRDGNVFFKFKEDRHV